MALSTTYPQPSDTYSMLIHLIFGVWLIGFVSLFPVLWYLTVRQIWPKRLLDLPELPACWIVKSSPWVDTKTVSSRSARLLRRLGAPSCVILLALTNIVAM